MKNQMIVNLQSPGTREILEKTFNLVIRNLHISIRYITMVQGILVHMHAGQPTPVLKHALAQGGLLPLKAPAYAI